MDKIDYARAAGLLYIAARNDTNGNPRRGWVVMSADGSPLGFVDEGYEGAGALDGFARLADLTRPNFRINVSVREYKRARRTPYAEIA